MDFDPNEIQMEEDNIGGGKYGGGVNEKSFYAIFVSVLIYRTSL